MILNLNIHFIRVHKVILKISSKSNLRLFTFVHYSKSFNVNRKSAINCTWSHLDNLILHSWSTLFNCERKYLGLQFSLSFQSMMPFEYFIHKFKANCKTINKAQLLGLVWLMVGGCVGARKSQILSIWWWRTRWWLWICWILDSLARKLTWSAIDLWWFMVVFLAGALWWLMIGFGSGLETSVMVVSADGKGRWFHGGDW